MKEIVCLIKKYESWGPFKRVKTCPNGPKVIFLLLKTYFFEYLRSEPSPAARRCACFYTGSIISKYIYFETTTSFPPLFALEMIVILPLINAACCYISFVKKAQESSPWRTSANWKRTGGLPTWRGSTSRRLRAGWRGRGTTSGNVSPTPHLLAWQRSVNLLE